MNHLKNWEQYLKISLFTLSVELVQLAEITIVYVQQMAKGGFHFAIIIELIKNEILDKSALESIALEARPRHRHHQQRLFFRHGIYLQNNAAVLYI